MGVLQYEPAPQHPAVPLVSPGPGQSGSELLGICASSILFTISHIKIYRLRPRFNLCDLTERVLCAFLSSPGFRAHSQDLALMQSEVISIMMERATASEIMMVSQQRGQTGLSGMWFKFYLTLVLE